MACLKAGKFAGIILLGLPQCSVQINSLQEELLLKKVSINHFQFFFSLLDSFQNVLGVREHFSESLTP